MLKNPKLYIIIITIIILTMVLVAILNPLRKNEDEIRENMLKITPLGTNMEEVITKIEEHSEWEIDWIDNQYGYSIDNEGIPGENNDVEVGNKSIRITAGNYNDKIIFPVHVIVYYGFDENSKLIDIAVDKDIDTL